MSALTRVSMLLPLTLALSAGSVASKDPDSDALEHLIGKWSIRGVTRGKQTVTSAEVTRAFNGKFLEIHIYDQSGRDKYEARVFVGRQDDGQYVAHWLDGTGAETSRTLGHGTISGNTLQLTFPYPEGEFRDSVSYDRVRDRWRLLILMGPQQHPEMFSDWSFKREVHRAS